MRRCLLTCVFLCAGCNSLSHQQQTTMVAAGTYTSATVAFMLGDKQDSAQCQADAQTTILVCDTIAGFLQANPSAVNDAVTAVNTSGMLAKLPNKLQSVIKTALGTMAGNQSDIEIALAQIQVAARDYLATKKGNP